MFYGVLIIVWLIDRLHVWAPSWAFTCHVCRTSWGWSCSSGWPGWWALEASWEPSLLSSCVAPRSVLNAHTLQGTCGVRYASGGTHKLIHYTNRHTILQIWMYFTPDRKVCSGLESRILYYHCAARAPETPFPELRVSFYPSAPLTGDCLHLYNHFVVSHFGELVCEHAR